MALLDEAARKRIEATIEAVERSTSGEIVIATVPRSDAYHEVRLGYGAVSSLAVAAILHWFFPDWPVPVLLWIQAGLIALVWLVLNAPGLLRALVPAARSHLAVTQRAQLEFLAHQVFATRDRTGVLILISELEHRVVILGDSGIYAQIQAEGFQIYVDRIVEAIRAGRAADGVCAVIEDIGKVLTEKFPVRPDDRNELPNQVRRAER